MLSFQFSPVELKELHDPKKNKISCTKILSTVGFPIICSLKISAYALTGRFGFEGHLKSILDCIYSSGTQG